MHIDWWTLALQTVNVLILVWLLGRFLYRPVMAIVDRRQAEARKLMADAAEAHQRAEDARIEAERMRAAVLAEQERRMSDVRQTVETERAALMARARGDSDKLRTEAMAAIARDRAAAQSVLADRAQDLAIEIARRLLGRIPSTVIFEPFLDGLCTQVATLSPPTRAAFATAALEGEVAIEVVTAAPLAPDDAARVGGALERAFGSRRPLAFRSDPAVIAGIELVSRHATVRNSLRADLERIRKELEGDDGQCDGVGQLARTRQADGGENAARAHD